MQMNEIFDTTQLKDLTDDAIASFPLSKPIGNNAVVAVTFNGVTYTAGEAALGTTAATTALAVADFDNFRAAVATAISVLDKKIDEVLKISNADC